MQVCTPAGCGKESNGQGPEKGNKNIALQADADLGDPGQRQVSTGPAIPSNLVRLGSCFARLSFNAAYNVVPQNSDFLLIIF